MKTLFTKLKNSGWFALPELLVDQYGPLIGIKGISIYVYLSSKTDETNYAICDPEDISKKLTLSKRKVEKTLRKLERMNLIRINSNELYEVLRLKCE